MTRLLTGSFETKFACVFRHEFFETLKSDDYSEGDVDRLSMRLYAKDLHSFIRQISVQADGGNADRHIYSLSCLYIDNKPEI
jgi:hypothetical protein